MIGPSDESAVPGTVEEWDGFLCEGNCRNESFAIPDLGFDFFVFGSNVRNVMHAHADTYMSVCSACGAPPDGNNIPTFPGLFLGAAEGNSAQIIAYKQMEDAFVLRWEGMGEYDEAHAPGVEPEIVVEVTFGKDNSIVVSVGEF